jgi:hypothetical protein
MMGFLVSTAAVFFTAWIVYVATYRAAYMQGQMDMLRDAARNQGIVPAGTHPECTTDPNCPLQRAHQIVADAARWTGCPESVKRDPEAARRRDDEIYGRHG